MLSSGLIHCERKGVLIEVSILKSYPSSEQSSRTFGFRRDSQDEFPSHKSKAHMTFGCSKMCACSSRNCSVIRGLPFQQEEVAASGHKELKLMGSGMRPESHRDGNLVLGLTCKFVGLPTTSINPINYK